MKILSFLVFPIMILFLISCSGEDSANMESERAAVMKVLDDFVKAHDERNLDLLMTCFSEKPDILILGTDEDELWVDKHSMAASQKRAYESFNTIRLSVRDKVLKMCKTGKQAYFYMKVNWFVEAGDERYTFDGIRTTGVLEKEDNDWKIVQLHTSMPVKGQAVRY
jgi:hypothetical protein